jgi:D-amino-acid dehydrogenase
MPMKVAVIGAGIVGVTTAYELAVLGHQVSVYEQQGSVAAEASFAHAGVIHAGHIQPWPHPGLAGRLLYGLLSRDAALPLRAGTALRHLPWLWRSTRSSQPSSFQTNHRALLALAQFSRDRLLALTRQLGLDYEQMPGFTILLRQAQDLAAAQPALARWRELGVPHDVLDAAHCRHFEPALDTGAPLHAGIHLPQDGVGNCRQFAQLLKAQAQDMGATFHFGARVLQLLPGAPATVVLADGSRPRFDAVVVCAGVAAKALLAKAGIKLPVLPVYGYSVTAPLRHFDGHASPGPRAALHDAQMGVTICRLGQRVRVSGGVEIAGSATQMTSATLARLYRVLDNWFPAAAVTREAQAWKGAQALLPDGLPVVGESGAAGLWLNIGHGGSGWTLACGAARVMAERLSGRAAPLDVSRFAVGRLR